MVRSSSSGILVSRGHVEIPLSVSRRPWEIPVLLIKCGSRQKRYTTLCFGHPSCLLTSSLCELMLISKSLFIIRLFLPKARVIVVHCRCLLGISDSLSVYLKIQLVNVPSGHRRNILVCLVISASPRFVNGIFFSKHT